MAGIVLYTMLALFVSHASGQAAERCIDQPKIARTASLQMPRVRITTLAGDEARRFLAAYNAYPPETHLTGDAVMIIEAGPRTPVVFVVLFKNGCASAGGRIARTTYDAILAELARGVA